MPIFTTTSLQGNRIWLRIPQKSLGNLLCNSRSISPHPFNVSLATCKTYQKCQVVADMIRLPGVLICGGPFKVLGMEEVHNPWRESQEICPVGRRWSGQDMGDFGPADNFLNIPSLWFNSYDAARIKSRTIPVPFCKGPLCLLCNRLW